jgi:hypothetical protein
MSEDAAMIGEKRKQVLGEIKLKLEQSISEFKPTTEHQFEDEAMAYFIFCRYRDVAGWPNDTLKCIGNKVVWMHP